MYIFHPKMCQIQWEIVILGYFRKKIVNDLILHLTWRLHFIKN